MGIPTLSKSHQLGCWGEKIALGFLEMCGYTLLQQRYRRQSGEIDLILRREDILVFVEVKTRGRKSPAPPEAWVDGRKIARMKRTALHWLTENPLDGPCHYRFDVVAVEFGGEDRGVVLRHLSGIV
jgi:putative endonuclease